MSAVEVFVVLTLLSARERIAPGEGRIDTLAQWVADSVIVQAHRFLENREDGTFEDPVYTIEFVRGTDDFTEIPDTGVPDLLAALPQLVTAIDAQKALDGVNGI